MTTGAQVAGSTHKTLAVVCILLGAALGFACGIWPEWMASTGWPLPRLCLLSASSILLALGAYKLINASLSSGSDDNALAKCMDNLNEAQEKLLLQEKMVQVGLLTAGIAHEIKNPLNFVTNFSKMSLELMEELEEVLQSQIEKLDKAQIDEIKDIISDLKTNTQKVEEHGKRAESIVLNMLIQSRSEESVEKEPTDINPLIVEFLNLAYHGLRAQDSDFNIKIEKDLNDSTGIAEVISQPIGRVILNILNNGMYAAFKRSLAQEGHQPTIRVSSSGDADNIYIKIWDNGSGISKENLDNIFVPFYTTKPKGQGTGLGLSICHDIIVKDHHGKIEVESVIGEFTEFTIQIPRKKIE